MNPTTNMPETKVRVLIVDDSAVVRRVFTEQLSKDDGIEVVGTAPDAYVARDKIINLKPHVITLDIEMPRMDGLTFLRKLMRYHPLPVIIVSSLTRNGSRLALDALSYGAVDVVSKPTSAYSVEDMRIDLAEKIRIVAHLHLNPGLPGIAPTPSRKAVLPLKENGETPEKIIAIGASIGGTEAIRTVLSSMPVDAPATLVVQHMPAYFTASFAKRLDTVCDIAVREAKDGDAVERGQVLIAPGDHHMLLKRASGRAFVRVKKGPMVHHQRPSVDVLFNSIADQAGKNAVGIVLTGMGADGAKGLLAMKKAGARTIAQDKESCVVYGMPKEAVRIGAAETVLRLEEIAQKALEMICAPSNPMRK